MEMSDLSQEVAPHLSEAPIAPCKCNTVLAMGWLVNSSPA